MLERHKRFNRRGKTALLVIGIFVLILVIELIGTHETNSSSHKKADMQAKYIATLGRTKKTFADSNLRKAYMRQETKEVEDVWQQKRNHESKREQAEKVIYLTFDDGPSAVAAELLDTLNQFDAKATFFMLGPEIREHKAVVKQMVDEDFGVALHGITHDAKLVYHGSKAPMKEMKKDQQILKDVTQIHTQLVRLPYGSVPYLTKAMRGHLYQHDFKVWDWNVDSRDWELKDHRYVRHTIQAIKRVEKAGETPVVLMHDKRETVKYLPGLLMYLKHKGYKMKALTNEESPFTFKCEGRCHTYGS